MAGPYDCRRDETGDWVAGHDSGGRRSRSRATNRERPKTGEGIENGAAPVLRQSCGPVVMAGGR